MDTLLLIAKVKHGGNPLIFSLPAQRQNRMISTIQRIYGSVRGKTRMHTHFTKLFDSRPNVIGQCSLLIAHIEIFHGITAVVLWMRHFQQRLRCR